MIWLTIVATYFALVALPILYVVALSVVGGYLRKRDMSRAVRQSAAASPLRSLDDHL